MHSTIKTFSKQLSWPVSGWLYNLKVLCTILLFSFISSQVSAQIITIDGHTSDWSGKTYNAYSHDKNNSADNQFTQGSKDETPISSLVWNDGSTNNKGDITNGAAILGTEVIGGTSHNILYFAGDRAVNNGDAAIGFWFFKGTVALDTTSGPKNGLYAGGFVGDHQDGDLLVVSHFTQGGGTATILIYKWQGTGLLAPISSTTAAVNTGLENVPTGFSYGASQYPIGDFFEGKLDLTALNIPPCFANFLLETRNSQTLNASLQDLTFGAFTTSVPPPSVTPAARCGAGSITLGASGCTGGTLKWYDAATGGTQVNTGTTYTFNLTATSTFYVSCTTADGCLSARTPVTATLNGNPTVVASATPAGNVNIGSTPPHYSLSTTVNGVLNSTDYNYSWVQNPPEGATTGVLSSTSIANPTFRANIAQTFTWTVTATDKVTGCFNSSPVTRTVDPVAGCPLVPRDPVCSGTTHTYTADVAPASTETWTWSVNNGATIVSVANGGIANGGQSIKVTAGTQNFTLTLTKKFANTNLADQVCTYPVTVNPLAAAPAATYLAPTCTQSTFRVQITNPEVGSTYTLTQLDGNVVVLGPYVRGDLIFTGLHIGQGYSIVSVTSAGCKSNPNDCGTFTHTARINNAVTSVQQTVQQPTVLAAPNPFNDRIRFSIKSPVSGQGSLELYNMLGQQVKVVYRGNIEKGMIQTFEYNVPGAQRSNLIYLFRIGSYKTTGKLIGLK
jgi:hypothetical protein